MQKKYLFLLMFLVFACTAFLLKFRKLDKICQIDNMEAQTMSVQTTDFIGSEILNNPQRCSPKKIILRVPNNWKSQNGQTSSSKDNEKAPRISTLITYFREEEGNRFRLTRIDQIKGAWFYTKDETCLTWKWSNDNEEQVLALSMERNLQIHSPNVERIIFVISMPLALLDRTPKVFVQPYTWNKSGSFQTFRLGNNPNLKVLLGLTSKPSEKLGDNLNPGVSVIQSTIEELHKIDQLGGVHIDKDIEPLIVFNKAKAYNATSDKSSCAIPPDLKTL